MKRFKHINAPSAEKAASVLEDYKGKAKIIAGGTDLLGQMKDGILPEFPEAVVNIKTIPGLDYIKDEVNSLKIGALTRLEDIAASASVREKCPALAEAAGRTASPHIREQGTIGGNICQSNRCWYYWVPDNRFYCIRKGGKKCYAFAGEAKYHSIFGSTRVYATPCTTECPANVDIPSYMSKIREGDLRDAAGILLENNPLPAITGRVCPHFCESGCNRGDLDEPVSVRSVERYLGNYLLENAAEVYASPKNEIKKNIGIIGSGPAGLSAAWYLRTAGYPVTVFEAMDEPGGMLTYGIPSYRLPKDIVKKQINALEGAGIKFKTGEKVTDIQKLAGEFDAVLLASGAWKERPLGIKGEELMVSGTEFLRNNGLIGETKGKKVAVIGGGNVAMDVARTLLRLGAVPVVLYRRTRDEMPAIAEEIERAEEEGIEMQFLTLPVEAAGKAGKVALRCTRMKLGPADESGRPRPVAVEGSEFTADFDAAIKATGEVPDTSIVPAELLDKDGIMNPANSRLGKNIFAAGDCVTGPSTVVQAIAAGRKAADAVDRRLGGKGIQPAEKTEKVSRGKFDKDFLKATDRFDTPELSAAERIKSLETEDAADPKLNDIREEAERCFNCGCLAVNSSDIAPALIALGAVIKTNKREIEAEELFTVEGDNTTVLEDSEIVTEIEIPAPKAGTGSAFIKFALRGSIDFPIVNCAAAVVSEGGKVKSARICLNAVYNTPYRAYEAEKAVTGKTIDEATAEAAGNAAVADVCPLPDNRYKIQIAKILVKRTLLACNSPEH